MSLYEEMRDANHISLDATRLNKPIIRESRLLKDVKDGKEPEKKHISLDYFFRK